MVATRSQNTNDRWLKVASDLGSATSLLLLTPRAQARLSALEHLLWPPVRLAQVSFLYNEFGTPIAYCTWAFLTDDVGDDLAANPNRGLEFHEWNEGLNLWVMDVVAPFGGVRELLMNLRSALPHHDRGYAVRLRGANGGRRIAKASWQRSTV
jgi:cytolysin-activating lysine-acyltransferase